MFWRTAVLVEIGFETDFNHRSQYIHVIGLFLGSDVADSQPDYSYNHITKLTMFKAISAFFSAAGDICELIIWTWSFPRQLQT